MSDMRLWCAVHRRALEPGERKVYVFRYAVMAPSEDEAIRLAKTHSPRAGTGRWSAHDLAADGGAPLFEIGCHTSDPTEEEVAARKAATAAEKARWR